jgi:hypothetical protein
MSIHSEGTDKSWMRVYGAISVITGCVIGMIGVLRGLDLLLLAPLVATYLGIPFSGKVAQKKHESP